MRRREFISLLGGAAAWPRAARAQQPAQPMIGFLNSGSPEAYAPYLASFRQGLSELGYVDNQNVEIQFRWARSQNDKLPAFAAELVKAGASVISGLNSTPAVRAAKTATETIPIVFAIGADPVKVGLVSSFNHPGGNVTGISFQSNVLFPKRLELLHELLPTAERIHFVLNPANPNAASDAADASAAARAIGIKLSTINASSEHELDAAFAFIVQAAAQAILMDTDPLFTRRRDQIVALATRYRIPVLYDRREFVESGGLVCYGSSLTDAYRQLGNYTARILKGDKPANLPIMQPTKFEFVINLKTAKALGITFPQSMLVAADEVIE